jgi:hypothetical protein
MLGKFSGKTIKEFFHVNKPECAKIKCRKIYDERNNGGGNDFLPPPKKELKLNYWTIIVPFIPA